MVDGLVASPATSKRSDSLVVGTSTSQSRYKPKLSFVQTSNLINHQYLVNSIAPHVDFPRFSCPYKCTPPNPSFASQTPSLHPDPLRINKAPPQLRPTYNRRLDRASRKSPRIYATRDPRISRRRNRQFQCVPQWNVEETRRSGFPRYHSR